MLTLSYAVDAHGLAEQIPEGALVLWNAPGVVQLQDLQSQLVLMVRKATDATGSVVPVVIVGDDDTQMMLPLYAAQVVSVVADSFAQYTADARRAAFADFVQGVYQQSDVALNPAIAINALYEWSRDKVEVAADVDGQRRLLSWLESLRVQFSRVVYVLQNIDLCSTTKLDWKMLSATGVVR